MAVVYRIDNDPLIYSTGEKIEECLLESCYGCNSFKVGSQWVGLNHDKQYPFWLNEKNSTFYLKSKQELFDCTSENLHEQLKVELQNRGIE